MNVRAAVALAVNHFVQKNTQAKTSTRPVYEGRLVVNRDIGASAPTAITVVAVHTTAAAVAAAGYRALA